MTPIETRARFDEALPLVLRAWTEAEPFAFHGHHSQHPHVNIWPRPVQDPHPPVSITGIGNPQTMQFTLENGYGFNYFGWLGVKNTGPRIFDRFWDIAEKLGQQRNPYRLGMMQAICVGETDAEAECEYAPHVEYFFRKALGSIPMERLAVPGGIGLPGLQAVMRDPWPQRLGGKPPLTTATAEPPARIYARPRHAWTGSVGSVSPSTSGPVTWRAAVRLLKSGPGQWPATPPWRGWRVGEASLGSPPTGNTESHRRRLPSRRGVPGSAVHQIRAILRRPPVTPVATAEAASERTSSQRNARRRRLRPVLPRKWIALTVFRSIVGQSRSRATTAIRRACQSLRSPIVSGARRPRSRRTCMTRLRLTKTQVLIADRVSERRRAAQLARHYRDQEGLTIAEIARRLGRAEATVKAYLYDPMGDKARGVKARYRGVCRGCGAPTSAHNGKGDAYAYCKRCHPGAIARQWTRERVREAMRAWRARYDAAPSSYDWSHTHARRRGGEPLERLQAGEWPAPSTVIDLYGSWAAAVHDAFGGA